MGSLVHEKLKKTPGLKVEFDKQTLNRYIIVGSIYWML